VAESYTGEVRNGVVVFDPGALPPPEGTRVGIETSSAEVRAELSEILFEFAGQARGLPPDMAEQHDHYPHGQPRK
jgi:hypothetical protein